MDTDISKSIGEKLTDALGDQPAHKAVAALWQRWFDVSSRRLGVSINSLYESISIDIAHSSKIAALIGREIDIPDQLTHDPDLLTVLSNEEILEVLSNKIGLHTEEKEIVQGASLKEWMQSSALVEKDGMPRTFYHGSFGDIEYFDKELQGKNSRLGKGFYFTSNPEDASDNYATPDSPELQAKAQAIQLSLRKSSVPLDQIDYNRIKEGLVKEGGAVYPCYLRMNNPFTISNKVGYYIGKREEAFGFKPIMNTVMNDYEGSVDQTVELMQSLHACITTLDAINIASEFALKHKMDGLPLRLVQNSGYDGVIDKSAGNLWHTPNETEHYIVFEPDQIKSAIGNRGTYSNASSNILYQDSPQYSSVLFQFGGTKANQHSASLLRAAKRMVSEGVNMDEIRTLTGWHKFVDNKWRFEFSDATATLRREEFQPTNDHYDRLAQQMVGARASFQNITPRDRERIESNFIPSYKFTGCLHHVLDHKKLFSHYPQIGGIYTQIEIHPDINTTSANITREVAPRAKLHVIAPNASEALKAIIHETQHAIQSIESFGAGGSPADYENQPAETKSFYQKQLCDLESIKDFAHLHKVPLHEAADRMKGLISSSSAVLVQQSTTAQVDEYIQKLKFEIRAPKTRYHFLSGEYEARQTEARMQLSEADRAKTPIIAFEPIDLKDLEVVIRDNGGPGAANYSPSQPASPLGALLRNPIERKFLMLLDQNHNPSTLIHESCHLFLDVFSDLATQEDAPQSVKDDFNTICKFVGCDPETPFSDDQHEMWAEACEKYFLQGEGFSEAPELFNRLNHCMKESYASVNDLAIEIPNEVKAVLDNMFDLQNTTTLDFVELSQVINQSVVADHTGPNR